MTALIVMHQGGCPRRVLGHTDTAKRISDVSIQMWITNGWNCVGKWMAFRLQDGKWDGALYDTKRDAVRHQSNEFYAFYVKIHPGGMHVCEAEVMLKVHRQMYDRGWRLADPDAKTGGPDIIPRIGMEKVKAQIQALGGK